MELGVGSFGRVASLGLETPPLESRRQGQSQHQSAARRNARRQADEYRAARRRDAQRTGATAAVTRELLRAIGRWDLLALVINGIVGAGIFGLPAKVHALLGVYGLWAIIACALIIGLVVLCFAEVASRFTQTGGPFVYAVTAFGPFTGFLTGWILLAARLTGCCAICSLLLQYAAYFAPALNHGAGRVARTVIIVGALTLVHVLGIKRAVLFGNIVTVGKLLPLLIFVALGLLHVDLARFSEAPAPANAHFAQAVLLLGFAFVGWESVVVTAGETRDPQRDLPFSLIAGLSAGGGLYL